MTSSRLRRDINKLFESPPPDIIFPEDDSDMLDMSSLSIYLLGPEGTAYNEGAWKITLKIPLDYPQSPPKAYFNTKIFHPNVQPSTGEVCVDTLKRDWTSDVDLIHILLTIRCLLIQPNPESSLNEEAGKLLLEDYDQFESTARLMTKVHALNSSTFHKPSDSADTINGTSSESTGTILQPLGGKQPKSGVEGKKKKKTGLKRL